MTRLLDLFGTDLATLRGDRLIEAIRDAEGRTVLAEVVAGAPPLLAGTANAELVAAFGADLVCLNMFDPARDGAVVSGIGDVADVPADLAGLGRLLGRPVGCNLEPATDTVPPPFRATAVTAAAAQASGAAFVIVTANPSRRVGLDDLTAAVSTVREHAPDVACFAGKMHHAGEEEATSDEVARRVVDAGAHGVLVPVPGTVPGVSEDAARATVAAARSAGALAVSTIGTSQEGADVETIRRLALTAKRIGVDVHHLGDAGYTGIAAPDNVYAYSVAIRGVRHTWNRMARNVRASWQGEERR